MAIIRIGALAPAPACTQLSRPFFPQCAFLLFAASRPPLLLGQVEVLVDAARAVVSVRGKRVAAVRRPGPIRDRQTDSL